jgi:disulfide bond formation protein DsbB
MSQEISMSQIQYRLSTIRPSIILLIVAAAMASVVGVAWIFQIFGYVPCQLCLWQRIPYYVGVSIALLGALAIGIFRSSALQFRFGKTILIIVGLVMLTATALGVYHSGVEWSWWAGPTSCGSTGVQGSINANDLFSSLDTIRPPSCTEAAGRFFGLSFAGWNVVASLMIAGGAFAAAGLAGRYRAAN